MQKNIKKKFILSVVMLAFSLIIFTTVIFGWFYINATPGLNTFEIKVVNNNTNVTFNISSDTGEGNQILLTGAYPGKEYNFEMALENTSDSNTAEYKIYFQGFSDNLTENGVDLDMFGIFQTKKLSEDAYYFRQTVNEYNQVIIDSGTVLQSETSNISFKLIFSDYYMYSDGTTTNEPEIINQFQDKQFIINKLVVEII